MAFGTALSETLENNTKSTRRYDLSSRKENTFPPLPRPDIVVKCVDKKVKC
jgi:hypothetical protein